jgi:hypothetical protein
LRSIASHKHAAGGSGTFGTISDKFAHLLDHSIFMASLNGNTSGLSKFASHVARANEFIFINLPSDSPGAIWRCFVSKDLIDLRMTGKGHMFLAVLHLPMLGHCFQSCGPENARCRMQSYVPRVDSGML